MYKQAILFSTLIAILFSSCIKDDFIDDNVDPVIRITNAIDTIAINTMYQFEHIYLNNIGFEETVMTIWQSSDEAIISIDDNGLATALQLGTALITVSVDIDGEILNETLEVVVGQMTTVVVPSAITGTIQTTSSYRLEGDFEYSETDDGTKLTFADNYEASTALPGLYIYLSNNPNSVVNALEIGKVQVFSGAHEYEIANIGLNDYSHIVYFCKPFNVKVGDGAIN